MHEVVMPKIDVAMETGRVIKWLKKEGDKVKKEEPIALAISEKLTFEISAPETGELHKIFVSENVDVPIGQVIAVITEPGDQVEDVNKAIEEITKSLPTLRKEKERMKEMPRERVKISPLAKKIAEQYSIDIRRIKGTGPGGRIVKDDVLKAVEESKFKIKKTQKTIPLSGIRSVIAERMTYSFQNVPHAVLIVKVNMSEAVKLCRTYEKEKGISLSYTAIFAKAVAKALMEHPIMNSTLDGKEIKMLKDINLGIAVSTERGLIVPVIHNADKRSLVELTNAIRELAEKARLDKLSLGELTGGTFTITNLGMFGVDAFIPIINPKQAGILAIGKIVDEVKAVDRQNFRVQPTAMLSLSFDHRITDGAPAAKFLARVKEIVENPSLLLP